MLQKIKNLKYHPRIKQLSDIRNLGLYVFAGLVLLVSYNSIKVIDTNYQLQKKIARLQQQNVVQELQNSNLGLRNKFLETNQYIELTARKQFAKAAPGEKLILVPEEVAKKYIADIPSDESSEDAGVERSEPFYQQNAKAWWEFFFGD